RRGAARRVMRCAWAGEASASQPGGGAGDGGTAHTAAPTPATPAGRVCGMSGRPARPAPGGRRPVGLSDRDRARVRAAVLALDPLCDEQIAGVCEVITTSRDRWRREDTRDPSP